MSPREIAQSARNELASSNVSAGKKLRSKESLAAIVSKVLSEHNQSIVHDAGYYTLAPTSTKATSLAMHPQSKTNHSRV